MSEGLRPARVRHFGPDRIALPSLCDDSGTVNDQVPEALMRRLGNGGPGVLAIWTGIDLTGGQVAALQPRGIRIVRMSPAARFGPMPDTGRLPQAVGRLIRKSGARACLPRQRARPEAASGLAALCVRALVGHPDQKRALGTRDGCASAARGAVRHPVSRRAGRRRPDGDLARAHRAVAEAAHGGDRRTAGLADRPGCARQPLVPPVGSGGKPSDGALSPNVTTARFG